MPHREAAGRQVNASLSMLDEARTRARLQNHSIEYNSCSLHVFILYFLCRYRQAEIAICGLFGNTKDEAKEVLHP
jgi:hypothetical protein